MKKAGLFISIFFYNVGITLYHLLINLSGFFGNSKAKKWVQGRKLQTIQVKNDKPLAWFHFASLGEFEQGRPVLEQWKEMHPEWQIAITFFSPSGYEVRKNYPLADYVFYLPMDTQSNAIKFINELNPSVVFFTKYEYWYHYFNELHKRNIPLYVISAIFRPRHIFFKWYGALYRHMLSLVSHVFVQDVASKKLLDSIGNYPITVSGDTRFDRVVAQLKLNQEIPFLKEFIGGNKVLIAGSTWSADEELLVQWINTNPQLKYIIAPHELKEEKMQSLIQKLKLKTLRYTELNKKSEAEIESASVLIIDTMGLLSAIYRYGSIAYIGGGFGKGIHNTLEAAAFGLPVIFGPNYTKFNEAKELIHEGAAFSISTYKELEKTLRSFLADDNYLINSGARAAFYVQNCAGATERIISEIR